MPDRGGSASAAIRRSFFGWVSNRRPAHDLGRSGLHHPSVHGQRLQVRQSLLKSQPLLVEMVPGTPQFERNLPTRFFPAADNLDDLIEAALVVRLQDLDASLSAGEGTP